jgi:hypothetical protein
MNARKIQDQKDIAGEMFVQQVAHANAEVSIGAPRGTGFAPPKANRNTLSNRRQKMTVLFASTARSS